MKAPQGGSWTVMELINIHQDDKTPRYLLVISWDIPASSFQSESNNLTMSNNVETIRCDIVPVEVVFTWAGLEGLDDHVPHGPAAQVLLQHGLALQLRLPAQHVFGHAQSFVLQVLLRHAFSWRDEDRREDKYWDVVE